MSEVTDRSMAPRDPLIGRVLDGRYRVVRRIGKGGMGNVYLAEHVLIGRKVAIKTLHESLCNAELIERFHREARVAAAIGNEHIVDVTDMGRLESGSYYLVLEYLDGMDLGFRVASQGPLGLTQAVDLSLQLCAALRSVHAAGIVHRDLKPDNLFLIDRDGTLDFLKVLDFGVCKFREGEQWKRLTATGVALGTPHYMAPEQVEARSDVDQRADVYAAGAILHFALTGMPPFDGPSLPSLFLQICDEPPKPLRSLRADVPRALEQIVLRALAKRREDRFHDAAQLAAALQTALQHIEHEPPQQAPRNSLHEGETWPALNASLHRPVTLPGRRRWPVRLAGASLAATLALGATQLVSRWLPEPAAGMVRPRPREHTPDTSLAPATQGELPPPSAASALEPPPGTAAPMPASTPDSGAVRRPQPRSRPRAAQRPRDTEARSPPTAAATSALFAAAATEPTTEQLQHAPAPDAQAPDGHSHQDAQRRSAPVVPHGELKPVF